jgi:death-on-curing protein
MEVEFLDLLDVLEIHESRMALYGGALGVRDLGLLQSAIAQPQAGLGDQFLHADIYEMAAAYLYHIIQNHPFLDGNKRTALAVALVFMDINNIEINAGPDALYSMTMDAAEGKIDKNAIAEFFRTAPRQ